MLSRRGAKLRHRALKREVRLGSGPRWLLTSCRRTPFCRTGAFPLAKNMQLSLCRHASRRIVPSRLVERAQHGRCPEGAPQRPTMR